MIGRLVDEQAKVEVARLIGVLIVELAAPISAIIKGRESNLQR